MLIFCELYAPLGTVSKVILFTEVTLADCHSHLHQLIVVDHGSSFFRKAKALVEQNSFIKHRLPMAAYNGMDHIPILKTGLPECSQGNICPQVSKIRVIDLKHSPDFPR